jgi:hypothetical protein
MSTLTFSGPAGSLVLHVNEADGSIGIVDLTAYANTLLATSPISDGCAIIPSGAPERTAVLGELAWTDDAHFMDDQGGTVDPMVVAALLGAAITHALVDAVNRVNTGHEDRAEG